MDGNINYGLRSILAGIAISIGSLIYLKFQGVIGAVFFSIGLIMVFNLDLKLYTGVVANTFDSFSDLENSLLALAGNALGCLIMFIFPSENAFSIVHGKLDQTFIETLVKSFLCGLIIYSATQNKKDVLSTIMHVSCFILCGAEHSIADLCYIFAGRYFTIEVLTFVLTVILGNAIGAITGKFIHKHTIKKE